MARQNEGQIQPVARPVQAFIQPVRVSIAEPARPAQLPGAGQVNTIQQGGTPSIQGYNPYEALAGNLEAFNRQLTPALQTLGLQFADQQMRRGEQAARAAALQGMVQNDVAMEKAEQERNKATRALARKDPQAAGIMALLNPYYQAGYERGQGRLAGSEVALGLPDALQKRVGEIDYNGPDQGQGALRRISDEYTRGLLQRYGLTAESPAAQRFVLPEVEKERERLGLQMMKDRKDYLDGKATEGAAALIRNVYAAAMKSGTIEWNGVRYTRTGDTTQDKLFEGALQANLQNILNQATKNGAMPGQGREREQAIFKSLAASGWFSDPAFLDFVGGLESSTEVVGADGKPILDAQGKPAFQRLRSLYQVDDLDARIKYGAAARAERTALREDTLEGRDGFDTYIWKQISHLQPGPQREAVRDEAIAQYYNANKELMRKAGISLPELIKRAKTAGDLSSSLYIEDQPDPTLPERELMALTTRRGDAWNAAREKQRGLEIADKIRDDKKRSSFLERWTAQVESMDKENTSMNAYKASRDRAINEAVNQNLNTYYGPSSKKNQGDRSASRSRQWQAFVPYINAVLMQKEAEKKSRLTDAEIYKYSVDALSQYGKGKDGDKQKDWLFPGSQYTTTPGVTPKTKPGAQAGTVGPARGPGPQQPAPYVGPVYDLQSIEKAPDRKLLLRNYESKPIFGVPTLRTLVDMAVQGKPWPKSYERLWRDAGAPNGGQFLMDQIRLNPDAFDIPPALEQKILKGGVSSAGAGDALVSLQRMLPTMPNLAQFAGLPLDLLTGERPASAATRYGELPMSAGGGRGRRYSSANPDGLATIRVADRLGIDPADLAAIFSFETGGTLSPSEPGRGAARGRVGLIQAGPNEMREYGIHGGQSYAQQLEGVARYLIARGVRPGMGLPDLYAAVNGGNVREGWRADGNGTVARSEATQRLLRQHRAQAMRRLGLTPN